MSLKRIVWRVLVLVALLGMARLRACTNHVYGKPGYRAEHCMPQRR